MKKSLLAASAAMAASFAGQFAIDSSIWQLAANYASPVERLNKKPKSHKRNKRKQKGRK